MGTPPSPAQFTTLPHTSRIYFHLLRDLTKQKRWPISTRQSIQRSFILSVCLNVINKARDHHHQGMKYCVDRVFWKFYNFIKLEFTENKIHPHNINTRIDRRWSFSKISRPYHEFCYLSMRVDRLFADATSSSSSLWWPQRIHAEFLTVTPMNIWIVNSGFLSPTGHLQ